MAPILLLAPHPQIFRPSDIPALKRLETRLKMAPRASSPNFARLLLWDHPFKTSVFFRGGGQKLAKYADRYNHSSKKLPTVGVGVKNCENLPTS